MINKDVSIQAEILIKKFSNSQNKNNLKKIDNINSKLSYYNLFFDHYEEMFSQDFTFVEDIDIVFDPDINVFMISLSDLNNKKIIFDTPHYRIINFNFPSSNWEILKLR